MDRDLSYLLLFAKDLVTDPQQVLNNYLLDVLKYVILTSSNNPCLIGITELL